MIDLLEFISSFQMQKNSVRQKELSSPHGGGNRGSEGLSYLPHVPQLKLEGKLPLEIEFLAPEASLFLGEENIDGALLPGGLKKEMATHSSILAWKVPWTEGAWRAIVHSIAESDTTEHACRRIWFL